MYLGWFDDTKSKPVREKIADAVQHYRDKLGQEPRLVLVNEADAVEYEGVEVRVSQYIRPNVFFVGVERVD